MSLRRHHQIAKWSALFVAFAGFLLQMTLSYPGVYLIDSDDQLKQAMTSTFNDWHPPAMAYLWRFLIDRTGTAASLYVAQAGCYWMGIGLIGDGLLRCQQRKSAVTVLIAGLFPFFLYVNSLLVKDSQMAAALLAAFALVFWFRIQNRRLPWAVALLAGLLFAYAVLVRINCAFAVGPLLLYCRSGVRHDSLKRIIGASVMLTLATLFAVGVINQRGFDAHHTEPIRSLQIFDLVGVAKLSGDRTWITQLLPIDAQRLDQCYTPYWWDSVSPWGSCPEISATVMNQAFKTISSDRDVYPASEKLTGLWLNSIRHHPLSYLEHRVKHLNAELNFFVPALERRFGLLWYTNRLNAHDIKQDYIKKSFPTWPAPWITLALFTLACTRHEKRNRLTSAANALALSGLLYGAAYLVIGVAAEPRYMYWTMLASFLAAAVSFNAIATSLKAKNKWALFHGALVLLVIVLGMTARMMDWQFMMH